MRRVVNAYRTANLRTAASLLLEDTHRRTLLGIAQVVMLGELAVNQLLDNLVQVEQILVAAHWLACCVL
jgi:hypothetical protein